jgi:hypothetical protein
MQDNKNWYKEKTFRFTMACLFILGALMTIGTSIVDGELNLIGLWFWAFAVGVVLPLSYLMRNNP